MKMMLKELTEEIVRLSLPVSNGMDSVNSYLIRGEDGYTVIDTGLNTPETIQRWEEVSALGMKLVQVVLSHYHADHVGLAKWMQERFQIPVIMSRIGYEFMRLNRERLLSHAIDETATNPFITEHDGPKINEYARMKQLEADYFEPDAVFENYQNLRLGAEPFTAIWTPGHSFDHFCFYNPNHQIMLIGDHVLGMLSPVIPVWSEKDGNPLHDYFESLALMENYPVNLVLPGHGEPIPDLPARIAEIKARHHSRLEQICQLLKSGAKTAGQVCRSIYGTNLSEVMHRLEFSAILARMIYLESIGQISGERQNGKVYYSCT
jgi:glyoxylase-like metal-dependent hydrolase (beta-lactamase superfamily II)